MMPHGTLKFQIAFSTFRPTSTNQFNDTFSPFYLCKPCTIHLLPSSLAPFSTPTLHANVWYQFYNFPISLNNAHVEPFPFLILSILISRYDLSTYPISSTCMQPLCTQNLMPHLWVLLYPSKVSSSSNVFVWYSIHPIQTHVTISTQYLSLLPTPPSST